MFTFFVRRATDLNCLEGDCTTVHVLFRIFVHHLIVFACSLFLLLLVVFIFCCNLFISDIFAQFVGYFPYLLLAVVCFQLLPFAPFVYDFSLRFYFFFFFFLFSISLAAAILFGPFLLQKNANEKLTFNCIKYKNLTFIKVTFLQSYFISIGLVWFNKSHLLCGIACEKFLQNG